MSATINISTRIFIDFISAATAATYTTYYNWDWFYRITDNIIVGVCVGLIVFSICRLLHHIIDKWCRCLTLKNYKKRRKHEAKKRQ